ncbi:MAG: hypothetical protein KA419_08615 [Acidobacteria bacterium]|nr:hypothetical protein [Acidobacteriota bacterium]
MRGKTIRRAAGLAVLTFLAAVFAVAAGAGEGTLDGVLTLTWGDPGPGGTGKSEFLAEVTPPGGRPVRLAWDAARFDPGCLRVLNRRPVRVYGTLLPAADAPRGQDLLVAERIEPAGGAARPHKPEAVTGPQPWVTIPCKFSDVAAEPRTVGFFADQFGSTSPRLDHYWRELSYENINMNGSLAASKWYVLPHPKSHYVTGSPPAANLTALFTDATAAADPDIDFTPFMGINLFFNDELDGYAWGGARYATLDGVAKVWRTTWEPPWGYNNLCILMHEMGHGFGLPHSCFNPSSVYDSSWDVMSDSWQCNPTDPTFGCFGQHTIAHHKDMLGWVTPGQIVTVNTGSRQTVTLERLAQPSGSNPRLIKVPVGGSATRYYTVEARKRVGYDTQLPGESVIVHEVDTTRDIEAYVQGANGDTGAMIAVGSSFTDTANCVTVTVNSSSATGWTVTVSNTAGPGITTHPQNQTIQSGQTAALSVTASGAGALSYQWYQGTSGDTSTPVGTNAASYTTPPLSATTSYWVRVTDGCGSTNSSAATVTVQSGCTPPAIASHPAGASLCSGQSTTLTVTATGSTPFTYAWYQGASGNTAIPVGTNSNTFGTPALLSSTSYWVRVTNACGTADSNAAALTVLTAPGITSHPAGQTIASGQTATLFVSATGSAPLGYQWYQGASGNTSSPVGSNQPSYTTPALTGTTSYWVRVTNACGTANSNTAVITVSGGCEAPSIDTPPESMVICNGFAASLTVSASGTAPLAYQWYQGTSGDTSVPVGTDASAYITPTLSATTNFWVRVTNACGTVDTPTAVITVRNGPAVTVQPQSQSVQAGQPVYLAVVASGIGSLSYQWYQGTSPDTSTPVGTDSSGFTSPPLTQDTRYWVRVTDDCGSTDSNSAVITVTEGPVYTVFAAHVAESDMWWTRLSVVNLGLTPASLRIDAFGSDGVLVQSVVMGGIPAGGALRQGISTILSPEALSRDLWLKITSQQPLQGVLEFGTKDDATEVVMPMAPAAASLIFPYVVVVADWYTGLTLVNTGPVPAAVSLTAHAEDGYLLATTPVNLPAAGKYVRLIDQVFPTVGNPSAIRLVRVQSDQDLVGFELFGNLSNPGLAGLPAAAAPVKAPVPATGESTPGATYTAHYLEIPANDLFYTGVTFCNRGADGAMFEADLYDSAGSKLVGTSYYVIPYQQVTREIWTLFSESGTPYPSAARMRLQADQPFLGFELFFTRSGAFAFDGLPVVSSGSYRFCFPLVRTETGWASRLRLFNPSASAAGVSIKAYAEGGALLGESTGALAAGHTSDANLAVLFPAVYASIAWLNVESSQPVAGDLFFLSASTGRLGSYPGIEW